MTMDEQYRMFTFRVNEKQKERIKKAADELELNPSEFARLLVMGVTDAVITADSPDALTKKFAVLADYFGRMRLAKVAKSKLRETDETELET